MIGANKAFSVERRDIEIDGAISIQYIFFLSSYRDFITLTIIRVSEKPIMNEKSDSQAIYFLR